METAIAFELAPLFWGMIALMLVFAGAILAGIDPELTEVYLGNPRWLLATVGFAVVALVTIGATRPELGSAVRALFPN